MPDLPPVSIVAVEDCALRAPVGVERDLDGFYVGLLRFERDAGAAGIVYRAQNARLRFDVREAPIEHRSLRPLQVVFDWLMVDMEQQLIDRKADYVRQRGLTAGADTLLLLDPAGNWIELIPLVRVR